MKLNRLAAAALALVLTLPAAASASDIPAGWTPADGARMAAPQEVNAPVPSRYTASITVNGKALEPVTFYNYDPVTYAETEVTLGLKDIPGAPPGYVPMRLLCAADPKGFCEWFPEEDSALFSFHGNSILVYFNDCVKWDEGVVPGVQAYLADGVTYLPVSFLATLPGVEVDDHPELSTQHYDFTLVVSPLTALADKIREEAVSAASFEMTLDDMVMVYNIPEGAIEEVVAYAPMMTNPDTVWIAKVAPGQEKAVVEAFEAYVKQQVETFTWYLNHQLPKAENGKVVSQDGYVMLFIGEDADKAVELFTAGVKAL